MYTPGNNKWEGHKDIVEAVKAMMQEDRPLPLEKTDMQPFGVFDVDKGTKKECSRLCRSSQH